MTSQWMPATFVVAIGAILFAPIVIATTTGKFRPCVGISNYAPYEETAFWVGSARSTESVASRHSNNNKDENLDQNPMTRALAQGDGDALVYFGYFKGWTELSDSSSLIRLIFSFRNPLEKSGEMEVGQNTAEILFSTGFPGTRDYRSGYATKGRIRYETTGVEDEATKIFFSILKVESGVYANFSLDIEFLDADDSSSSAKECALDGSIVFRPASLPEVNRFKPSSVQ